MKINREYLISVLEIVLPGLAKRQIFAEQADSFAFADGKIFTYNDEISINHPVKEIDINGTIHAEEFYKFLKELSQEYINLSVDGEFLVLKADEIKAGFRLNQNIELPLIGIEKDYRWVILPEKFNEALTFNIPIAGDDKNKPITTCIHIRTDGFIEATDNARIGQFNLRKEIPVINNFLIPVKSAIQLVKLNPTRVSMDDSWIYFKTDQDTIFASRFLNDKFPKTDTILNVEGFEFEFPPITKELLERVEIFATDTNNVKGTININIGENLLTAEAVCDAGWIKEEIDIRYNDEPVNFSVAPYLLKYILERTLKCIIGKNVLKFEGENWEYVSAYFVKD